MIERTSIAQTFRRVLGPISLLIPTLNAQNVGIGTNTPLARLDVRGSVWIGTSRYGTTPPAQLNFNSDGSGVEINFMPNLYNKFIDVDATNFDITNIEVAGFTTVMRFAANNTSTSGFLWRTWDGSAYTSRMWLQGNNGFLGIGTTTPVHRLDVAGQARVQSAITITATSAAEGGQLTLAGVGDYTATGENCNSWAVDVVSHSSGSRFRIFRGSSGCSTPNNLEIFNILYNGNVGISEVNPQERFQIGNLWTFHDGGWKVITYNGRYDAPANVWRYLANAQSASMNFTNGGDILFRTASTGTAGNPITYGDRLMITNGGNIGIDITTPQARLDVRKTAGYSPGTGTSSDAPTTAIITASNTTRQNDWPNGWGGGLSTWDIVGASTYFSGYATRSDRRWKQNIEPLREKDIRDRFMQLIPVSYRIDPKAGICDDPDRLRFGFIANEIEPLFPNLVINAGLPDSVARGLEYDGFIPLLVSIIQAHEREIQALREDNKQLRERLAELERKIVPRQP